MQTQRAYAYAGEGFPYWMELGPADRLMTSLPLFHINAPGLLGAGLTGLWRRAGAAAALLGQRLPGRRPPARGDRVQRDRGDARDPDAPAAPARRRRHPAAALLHRAVTGARVAGGVRGAVRAAGGLRVRPVGVAVRPDLAARHPSVRHAGLGPPASDARSSERGQGRRRRGGRGRGRRHRRAVAAQPDPDARLLADARGDRDHPRGRLAAHRRPGHRERRRDLHLRLAAQGGPAPARAEPLSGRGRGRRAVPPGRPRGRRGGRAVGADRGRGEGVRRAGPGSASSTSSNCGPGRPSGSRRSRCRGSGSGWTHCLARRRRGWPSTGCRPVTRTASTTARPRPAGSVSGAQLRSGRTG